MADFAAINPLWKWNLLCQILCLFVPGMLFLLRTYIRIWIKRTWILEDYLSTCSYVSMAILSIISIVVVQEGGGVHIGDLAKPNIINVLYYINILQIWYGIAACLIRTTILQLYLRVFSPRRGSSFDVLVRALFVINWGFYFATTIVKICQCLPRQKIWDSTVPGTCVNLSAILITSGLFNILSEVAILAAPTKVLWNLNLGRKRKLAIYLVFTVGFICPIFSTVGFIQRSILASSPDQTYVQTVILLWANAELATGVIVICLPILPGLRHRRKPRPETYDTGGSSTRRRTEGPLSVTQRSQKSAANEMHTLNKEVTATRSDSEEAILAQPSLAFVNEIRGGAYDDDTLPWPLMGRDEPNPGQIVKITHIEQTV